MLSHALLPSINKEKRIRGITINIGGSHEGVKRYETQQDS